MSYHLIFIKLKSKQSGESFRNKHTLLTQTTHTRINAHLGLHFLLERLGKVLGLLGVADQVHVAVVEHGAEWPPQAVGQLVHVPGAVDGLEHVQDAVLVRGVVQHLVVAHVIIAAAKKQILNF